MKVTIDSKVASQETLEIWAGLDLGKSNFDAALYFADGKSKARRFQTTLEGVELFVGWCDEMLAGLNCETRLRVVMEATGRSSINVFAWLLKFKPSCGPAIVNPHFIKSFRDSLGVRNKTDKVDAQVIARYGHERRPAPDTPKTPIMTRLQELVRERQVIVDACTAEKNRLGEQTTQKEIGRFREQRLKFYQKQLKQIEKLLCDVVKGSENLRHDVDLLTTIPGVGIIVAMTVLAELGDLRRFSNARKLSAYAGLSPRQQQSGTTVNRTRLSKMGNKRVRPNLQLSARSLIGRANFAHGRYYEKLVTNGKSKQAARSAVARKQLVLMRAVLIKNKPYDDQLVRCGKVMGKTVQKSNVDGVIS